MQRRTHFRAGFTLIELLVAITIIGVLLSLLMPAVQASRAAARRIQCQNQLRQLGLALHNYHDTHACFPAGSYVLGPAFQTQSGWGWGAMILPHIEQTPLYQQLDFDHGTAVGANLARIATPVSIWRCPSDTAPAQMHIVPWNYPPLEIASGNYCGVEGLLREMSRTRMADVTDGTSQTLLLGERGVQPSLNGSLPHTSGWFGQIAFADEYEYRSVPHMAALRLFPINGSLASPQHFSSRHAGGAMFGMADGSVHFLSEHLDSLVFEALGTPNGGESSGSF